MRPFLLALSILSLLVPVPALASGHCAPKTSATYLCKARSLTGRFYSAVGPDEVTTQDLAIRRCQADSFRCIPAGCQKTGK